MIIIIDSHYEDKTILAMKELKSFGEKDAVAKYKTRYSVQLKSDFQQYKLRSSKELGNLIDQLKCHQHDMSRAVKKSVKTCTVIS